MSDPVTEIAPVAPAVVPPVPVVAPPADPTAEPGWLKERIAQAQRAGERAAMTALGVTDVASAKARLEAAAAQDDAKKTAAEKAAELTISLKASQTEAQRLTAIATEHAARMIGVLTPEQQAAVKAVAGDDPGAQLRAVHALAPTWAAQAATAAAAIATPPPATTSPQPSAPVDGATSTSPPDHKAAYQQIKQTNPFAAAAYGDTHGAEVYKT